MSCWQLHAAQHARQEKRCHANEDKYELRALVANVLESYSKPEGVSGNRQPRWMRSLTWFIRVVVWCGTIQQYSRVAARSGSRLDLHLQKWVYRVDIVHVTGSKWSD